MVADEVVRQLHLSFRKVLFHPCEMCSLNKRVFQKQKQYLVKPLTYMNLSGKILPFVFKKTNSLPADLVVVCDNMDLPPGIVKIKHGGSTAGHNGVKSVLEHAGETDFLRLYVGIGRPGKGVSVIDHVLGIPDMREKVLLQSGVQRAADAVIQLMKGTAEQKVMNEFNRKTDSN
jgi:PTH1 family peptidyl-tRNA hydrolase